MKTQSKIKIKHGYCYPESKTESLGCTKATSDTSHSSLLALTNEEGKAVEAYKLQVEKWRSMAIELARRNAIC